MTGIKHFTTTTKGIGGVIKRRISDFLVREITKDGKTLDIKGFNDSEVNQPELDIPAQGDLQNLHLTMEKFNLDTNDALRRITRSLRMSAKKIGYGGMKDRRAITAQRISIWNPDVSLLKTFKSRYVVLREPEWKNDRMEIGALSGNFFEITIRAIDMPEDELRKATEQCFFEMKSGVANYFGEQRFGGIRQVTHVVGKEFIRGNLEGAVMTYLTLPSAEEKEISDARANLAQSKDFAKALREFPKKFRYERSILHHLSVFPHDFVGAFQKLPRHLTYIFTHAYQSYLFNLVINERIESGAGLGQIEGDIAEEGVVTVPLFGFDTKLADGTAGEIERKVLEAENVSLENFKVKSFPELSCSGARKRILIKPGNPQIISVEKDELNEGKLKMSISFALEKGNYATTILRELIKDQHLQIT